MKIILCGDSISAAYAPEQAPQTGWGQELHAYLPGIEIINKAMPGRSSKSFLAEGRLSEVETLLEKGDVMLIQFAHNDENPLLWRYCEARGGYSHNLKLFVDTARFYKVTPVLLSPVCLRLWQDGRLLPSHGDYPAAMKAVADRCGAAFIDLYEESRRLVTELGEEGSKALFLHTQTKADDAHTSRQGAVAFAAVVAGELLKMGIVCLPEGA